MNKNLILIQELIKQAEQITYGNRVNEVVQKRAEILARRMFGDKTHYLKSLKANRYTPGFGETGDPNKIFEKSFNDGKRRLINLLKVMKEDFRINPNNEEPEIQSNKSMLTSDSIIVYGHNEEMKLAIKSEIENLRLKPILLPDKPNDKITIIEEFTDNLDVLIAVLLLNSNNKIDKPEKVKYNVQQYDTSELEFLIGEFGQEKIFVLHELDSVYEISIEYRGVLFVRFDNSGKWKNELIDKLAAFGVAIEQS